MARRMAAWLKVPDIGGDLQWFQAKGDVALAGLLWAAAVTGRTILDVYEWVQLHGQQTCLEILATHPGSTRRCSRWPSGCSRRTGRRAASATRST